MAFKVGLDVSSFGKIVGLERDKMKTGGLNRMTVA
jgi:hypothetical protein